MHWSYCRLLAAIVIAVTTGVVAPLGAQDTTGRKDTVPVQPPVVPAPVPPPPLRPVMQQWLADHLAQSREPTD